MDVDVSSSNLREKDSNFERHGETIVVSRTTSHLSANSALDATSTVLASDLPSSAATLPVQDSLALKSASKANPSEFDASLDDCKSFLSEILHLQLGQQFSARDPLFLDFFEADTYSKWNRTSENIEFGPTGILGAPRNEVEFVRWLRGGDSEFAQFHTESCRVLQRFEQYFASMSNSSADPHDSDTKSIKQLKEDRSSSEWHLAGAILDSGLVCVIGPRNSGKTDLLRRVLFKLEISGNSVGGGRGIVSEFPEPLLPLRVITLNALQTQDPFDLILYILNDLRQIVKASADETKLIEDVRVMLEKGTRHLGSRSSDMYHQSRLHLLKEKYSEVLSQITSVVAKATMHHQLVIILEDFELLAGDRQTFLYNLMDIISHGYARKGISLADNVHAQFVEMAGGNIEDDIQAEPTTVTPITAIMVTSRLDSFSMLEKRVASRFPQRQVIINGAASLRDVLLILYQHLIVADIPLLPERELLLRRRHYFHERSIASLEKAQKEGLTFNPDPIAPPGEKLPMPADPLDKQDDPATDLLNPDLAQLQDPNSSLSQTLLLKRRALFEWNRSVMNFFSKIPIMLLKQLEALSELTLNITDYYQVILSAFKRSTSPVFPVLELSTSIRDFITHLSGRVQIGLSCSVLQILLLVEMNRLEQQLVAGWEKSGNPFHDFALPSAAMAIDLGTIPQANNKGKRRSDGTQLFNDGAELSALGARQDTLRLQHYHFDRVYYEYSRWAASDPSLGAFKFPKHIVHKAFEGLLQMNLVSYCPLDRYSQSSTPIHVTRVSSGQQYVKLLISPSEIKMILDRYPEPLPQGLSERLRI